jgi:hypothetical protein
VAAARFLALHTKSGIHLYIASLAFRKFPVRLDRFPATGRFNPIWLLVLVLVLIRTASTDLLLLSTTRYYMYSLTREPVTFHSWKLAPHANLDNHYTPALAGLGFSAPLGGHTLFFSF